MPRKVLIGVVLALCALVPSAAGAYDRMQELANFQKPFERPRLAPASMPLSQPTAAVHYVNRNGALISAHLWVPATPATGRRPVVLFVNGDIAPENAYWFAAAAFARAGYVVMTYDPQGRGQSEVFGSGTDRLRDVDVQTFEGGEGDGVTDADSVEQATDALDFLLSTPKHPYVPRRTDGTAYDPLHPTPAQTRQVSEVAAGTVPAADPSQARVDHGHVGLVGHSRGADAVSIMAARETRIRAVVAWDDLQPKTFDDPAVPLRPRVPALGIADDYYEVPQPFMADPDPQGHSGGFLAARAAGVDTGELMLRGATHFEFSYLPGVPLQATLRGIDFATWYATAWLDRYVVGSKAAVDRLLTDRWRHDAPEAAVDPSGDGNLFSFYYRSRLAIHRPRLPGRKHAKAVVCDDLRNGCAALVHGPEAPYAVLVPPA